MNIVIDARDTQLGRIGVSVYSINIINQLEMMVGNKHQLTYLTSSSLAQPNVSGQILSDAPSASDSFFKKLVWYYKLPKYLEKIKADVYFGNFVSLPFQKNFPCPIVITAHDAASISTTALVGNAISRYRNKFFVNGWVGKATHIICISEYCKKEFSEIFGDKFQRKASVIHHGLPDEFRRLNSPTKEAIEEIKNKYANGNSYLFSLGTVYPKKNYERLVEAFSKIDDKKIHLIICGSFGYGVEQILNSPHKYGIPDRVHFLSSLPTEIVHTLMHGAKSFVFPSLYEGFGIPLLEAFYVGTPVICSNATCLPEIAGDAVCYFDPYSVDDITKAINYVITDDYVREKLVAAGRNRVKNFTWRKSAQEHLAVFEKLA